MRPGWCGPTSTGGATCWPRPMCGATSPGAGGRDRGADGRARRGKLNFDPATPVDQPGRGLSGAPARGRAACTGDLERCCSSTTCTGCMWCPPSGPLAAVRHGRSARRGEAGPGPRSGNPARQHGSRYTGVAAGAGGSGGRLAPGRGFASSCRDLQPDSGINFGSLRATCCRWGGRAGEQRRPPNQLCCLPVLACRRPPGEASDALLFALYPLVRLRNFTSLRAGGLATTRPRRYAPTAGPRHRRSDSGAGHRERRPPRPLPLGRQQLRWLHPRPLDNPTAAQGDALPGLCSGGINLFYARLQTIGWTGWLVFPALRRAVSPSTPGTAAREVQPGGLTGGAGFPGGRGSRRSGSTFERRAALRLPSREGGLPGNAMVGDVVHGPGAACSTATPRRQRASSTRTNRIPSGVGGGSTGPRQSWSAQASAWPGVSRATWSTQAGSRPRAYAQITHYFLIPRPGRSRRACIRQDEREGHGHPLRQVPSASTWRVSDRPAPAGGGIAAGPGSPAFALPTDPTGGRGARRWCAVLAATAW